MLLIIKPVKITDDDAVGDLAVAIFWRNAVVPSRRSSSGLVINEVSTAPTGIDGDCFLKTACSVVQLCNLCIGLRFLENIRSKRQTVFNRIGLHKIKQNLL